MKKISIIVVLFMFSIMSLNVGNVAVNAFSNEFESETEIGIIFSDENMIVETVEKTEIYEKTKITLLETGDVEYVEVFANFNAEPTYRATSSDGEVNIIQKKDDVVYIDDEVVMEVPELEAISDPIDDSAKSDNARATWIKMGHSRYSSAVYVTSYAAIAGLIASVLGLPAIGNIVTIASWVGSLALKTIYYDVQTYAHSSTYGLGKKDYKIYRYSNYTGLLGSGSGQFYYSWIG